MSGSPAKKQKKDHHDDAKLVTTEDYIHCEETYGAHNYVSCLAIRTLLECVYI